MDYHIFRQFADSWMLLAMVGFFVAAILWPFRPSLRRIHDDSANIPFRHEDRPAPQARAAESAARPERVGKEFRT
jgi:cytochrome c oxidase cbb3-type subunit 4